MRPGTPEFMSIVIRPGLAQVVSSEVNSRPTPRRLSEDESPMSTKRVRDHESEMPTLPSIVTAPVDESMYTERDPFALYAEKPS